MDDLSAVFSLIVFDIETIGEDFDNLDETTQGAQSLCPNLKICYNSAMMNNQQLNNMSEYEREKE